METPFLHTLKKRVCPSGVPVCTVGRGFSDFSEGLWGKEQPPAFVGRRATSWLTPQEPAHIPEEGGLSAQGDLLLSNL